MRAFLALLLIPILYSCGDGYYDDRYCDGYWDNGRCRGYEHTKEEEETETEETTTTTKKNNK